MPAIIQYLSKNKLQELSTDRSPLSHKITDSPKINIYVRNYLFVNHCERNRITMITPTCGYSMYTVQITFIFIDFRVCDFAFAFKTQNAPCVSRFKRILFSDRFQFAF